MNTGISLPRAPEHLPNNASVLVRLKPVSKPRKNRAKRHTTPECSVPEGSSWRQWKINFDVLFTEYTIEVYWRKFGFRRKLAQTEVVSIPSELLASDRRGVSNSIENSIPFTATAGSGRGPDEVTLLFEVIDVVQEALQRVDIDQAKNKPLGLTQALFITQKILQVIEPVAHLNPISAAVVKALQEACTAAEKYLDKYEKIQHLATSMRDMLSVMWSICSNCASTVAQNDLLRLVVDVGFRRVIECGKLINDYMNASTICQTVSAVIVTADEVDKLQKKFNELRDSFDRAVKLQLLLDSGSIARDLKVIIGRLDEARLRDLPRAERAHYDTGVKCLQGTQTKILDEIVQWVYCRGSEQNIFWLHGIAGTGKSTVASTIAAMFDETSSKRGTPGLGMLGAAFFCKHDDVKLKDPQFIFPTIAFRLAHTCPLLKKPILDALEHNPDLGHLSIRDQFQGLILGPLSQAQLGNSDTPPVLVVIDALDECGDADSRKPLLQCLATLAKGSKELPVWFKLLVTSRPVDDIETVLEPSVQNKTDTRSPDNDPGINVYVHHLLEKLRADRNLESDWPKKEDIDAMIDEAGGLFIWIKLGFQLIGQHEKPDDALKDVLSARRHSSGVLTELDQLYELYRRLLSQDAIKARMPLIRSVLGCIIHARVPLSFPCLCELLSRYHSVTEVGWAVGKLAIVLTLPTDWHSSGVMHVINPTLKDFLTNKQSHKLPFYIDSRQHESFLACTCLELMNARLCRDVLGIGDPSRLNEDIPQQERCMDEGLIYSCQYWVDHVAELRCGEVIAMNLLQQFFTEHLLEWFEALSWLEKLDSAMRYLRSVQSALTSLRAQFALVEEMTKVEFTDTLLKWCYDAMRFVQYHYPLLQQSALHTYISALAFTPRETLIVERYGQKYAPSLCVLIGLDKPGWSRFLFGFHRHQSAVQTVKFSPDGKLVASGSQDGIILIWDAETGNVIFHLPVPHSTSVTALSFSPDGKQLVAGSKDVVHVWDTKTGLPSSQQPFVGHDGPVSSLALSPDGQYIAAGYSTSERFLRIWNVRKAFEEPELKGHSGPVTSILFSPSGEWLASGSTDCSVRVWDFQSRNVSYKLERHGVIKSVAFSPDSKRLAFCVDDKAQGVRLWDIEGSVHAEQLFDGPSTSPPSSVAFSMDGKLLAAGFEDGYISIWEPSGSHRAPVLAFKGHAESVTEVHFSRRDSKLLVSCSSDKTVNVWDTCTPGLSDWMGADSPWEFAFSPNSKYLWAGGSEYYLWDTTTGKRMLLPPGLTGLQKAFVSYNTRPKLGSSHDRLVRVWAESQLRELEGLTQQTETVVRPPDGWNISEDKILVLKGIGESLEILATISSNRNPDAVKTEQDDDGWIWETRHGVRVKRICYLPLVHRAGEHPYLTSGTRAATLHNGRITLIDLSLLLPSIAVYDLNPSLQSSLAPDNPNSWLRTLLKVVTPKSPSLPTLTMNSMEYPVSSSSPDTVTLKA
ncbi:hypothetical protein AcV7_009704 [Taiwanofungus camphoratus]|nr:hypothetical protein AcV7_009704 [Antrodia cinnamomea]